jgi:hypothetical protein
MVPQKLSHTGVFKVREVWILMILPPTAPLPRSDCSNFSEASSQSSLESNKSIESQEEYQVRENIKNIVSKEVKVQTRTPDQMSILIKKMVQDQVSLM